LSHAERVARFQHLKSILEPFKHSPDAAEALSKKQVKVQRPEGRPAKPRKVSILAEGAQQVVYDPSFEAKMKRFLARTSIKRFLNQWCNVRNKKLLKQALFYNS
jgi:hypothetical protein